MYVQCVNFDLWGRIIKSEKPNSKLNMQQCDSEQRNCPRPLFLHL